MKKLRLWLQHRYLPLHLALLAMLLCAPSLWLGRQADDHVHHVALTGLPGFEEAERSPAELFSFVRGGAATNLRAIDQGVLPWFSHPDLRLSFWRPITGLTHWLDYQLWPETPSLMHLHSLFWLGAVIIAATLFYRRMLSSAWIAGLAALLFAVDDAHGLPAVWLANRNAMIAVFFVFLVLIAHDRWRKEDWRPGAFLAPAALLLGLLSNEGAVAAGPYLLTYALFLDRGAWPRRLGALVPCAAVVASWWLVYKQLGYGATGSAMYIDPGADPARFAKAIVERGPILFFGQWTLSANLYLVLSQRAGHLMWLAALVLPVVIAAILWPILKRDPVARFWAMGMILALIPSCATFTADRLLFIAGIGGMGLLAQFLGAMLDKAEWLPVRRAWRRPAWALCTFFITFHLILSPLGLIMAVDKSKMLGEIIKRSAASLPSDDRVRDQTVLIVNTPTPFISIYAPLLQALNGKVIPARTLTLGSGIYPTEIQRRDENTLLIRPAGGFMPPPGSPWPGHEAEQPLASFYYPFQMLDRLFHDESPVQVGRQIKLTELIIEITAITPDGRPAEAAFQFAKSLANPSLRWLQWREGKYAPFTVPAVGKTITLPAAEAEF